MIPKGIIARLFLSSWTLICLSQVSSGCSSSSDPGTLAGKGDLERVRQLLDRGADALLADCASPHANRN